MPQRGTCQHACKILLVASLDTYFAAFTDCTASLPGPGCKYVTPCYMHADKEAHGWGVPETRNMLTGGDGD